MLFVCLRLLLCFCLLTLVSSCLEVSSSTPVRGQRLRFIRLQPIRVGSAVTNNNWGHMAIGAASPLLQPAFVLFANPRATTVSLRASPELQRRESGRQSMWTNGIGELAIEPSPRLFCYTSNWDEMITQRQQSAKYRNESPKSLQYTSLSNDRCGI